MKEFLISFLIASALAFSPLPLGPQAHFVGQAHAGVFKKLGAALVAGLIIKAAAHGLTEMAKKKIASYVAKHAVDRQFLDAVIRHLGKFRSDPKVAHHVDDVISYVDRLLAKPGNR